MDPVTHLCRGCFRTLDEIATWSAAPDELKIEILAAVDKRRATHDPWGEKMRGECER
jgi:predicted Fe-S protein YdhL (DUF1289 family)